MLSVLSYGDFLPCQVTLNPPPYTGGCSTLELQGIVLVWYVYWDAQHIGLVSVATDLDRCTFSLLWPQCAKRSYLS